jgi:hypothetical protein
MGIAFAVGFPLILQGLSMPLPFRGANGKYWADLRPQCLTFGTVGIRGQARKTDNLLDDWT